jgi:iron complex transport system ATP-binding protein
LSLDFEPGQVWGILGCNGSGKTTLLNSFAALRPLDAGSIEINGENIQQLTRQALARQLGLLQQHTVYVFDATVLQTALIGRHPYLGYWQQESAEDVELTQQALRQTGLQELGNRNVTSLSGGEARRLAFATILVQQPAYMLLDEPSNHLDLHHQNQLMQLVRSQTKNSNVLAIAALHDVNLAARYCSHVLLLYGDGKFAAGPAAELLDSDRLSCLYHHAINQVQTDHGVLFYSKPGVEAAAEAGSSAADD